MGSDRAMAWMIALAATGFYVIWTLFGVPYFKTLVCADRILNGEVPYRDFWTMYAPGQFYAAALSLKLFGRELWAQAATVSLVWGLCAGQLYLLLRERACSVAVSFTGTIVFAYLTVKVSPEWSSYAPALAFLLMHWRAMARVLAGEPSASLFRAGIWLGAAAIFKHDVAGYVALASCIALGFRGDASPATWIRNCSRVALGSLLAAGPVILWLALVAPREAWTDLVVFPATEFRHVFGEPYPGWMPNLIPIREWWADPTSLRRLETAVSVTGRWASCLAPQLIFLVVLVRLGLGWRSLAAKRVLVIQWLAVMPFFFAAAHVQKNTHLISLAIAGLILLAFEWQRRRGLWIVLLAAFQVGGLLVFPLMETARIGTYSSDALLVELPGASGVFWSGREDRSIGAASRYLLEHLEPGESFYSGVARHDAIVIGNQRFYWLTAHPPCTRYNELHPGFADSSAGQAEIIESLEQGAVRFCVIWDFGWSDEVLDGIAARRREFDPELGCRDLDEYLEREYTSVARFGEYRILRRR